jgi:Tfp pilus assembly protein PilO
MADVPSLRRLLWKVLALFAIIDIAAVIVLVSPISSSSAARRQHLNELWNELQKKTHDAVPTRGIEQKVDQARVEIAQFYGERFPDSFAAVSDELGRLARENNVQLVSATYKTEDTDLPELKRVSISAKIAGDYTHEVKFINALERNEKFFLVDSVDLNEAGGVRAAPGAAVALQIGAETFLRAAEKPETVAETKTDEARNPK